MDNCIKDNSTIAVNNVITYLKASKVNFVVMQSNGEPVSWSDGSGPVIYGDREECDVDESKGEYISTEFDYIMSKVK